MDNVPKSACDKKLWVLIWFPNFFFFFIGDLNQAYLTDFLLKTSNPLTFWPLDQFFRVKLTSCLLGILIVDISNMSAVFPADLWLHFEEQVCRPIRGQKRWAAQTSCWAASHPCAGQTLECLCQSSQLKSAAESMLAAVWSHRILRGGSSEDFSAAFGTPRTHQR